MFNFWYQHFGGCPSDAWKCLIFHILRFLPAGYHFSCLPDISMLVFWFSLLTLWHFGSLRCCGCLRCEFCPAECRRWCILKSSFLLFLMSIGLIQVSWFHTTNDRFASQGKHDRCVLRSHEKKDRATRTFSKFSKLRIVINSPPRRRKRRGLNRPELVHRAAAIAHWSTQSRREKQCRRHRHTCVYVLTIRERAANGLFRSRAVTIGRRNQTGANQTSRRGDLTRSSLAFVIAHLVISLLITRIRSV